MSTNKPVKRHKNLLQKQKDFTAFREADKIISYLENPDGKTNITVQLRKQLDRYIAVNALKMRYKTNTHIIGILRELFGRTERQARYDIKETEYIFGVVTKIDHLFETVFLLEASRKNIELAFITKDNIKISKALETHKRIIGEPKDDADMPDFSKFEQHNYNIVLPTEIKEMLQGMMSVGALNLSQLIPQENITAATNEIEEARIISETDNENE